MYTKLVGVKTEEDRWIERWDGHQLKVGTEEFGRHVSIVVTYAYAHDTMCLPSTRPLAAPMVCSRITCVMTPKTRPTPCTLSPKCIRRKPTFAPPYARNTTHLSHPSSSSLPTTPFHGPSSPPVALFTTFRCPLMEPFFGLLSTCSARLRLL